MRRWPLRGLAATSALVAVLLAVAVNAATATLPGFLDGHPGRAWTLVAVLGTASVGCVVLAVRAGEPGEPGEQRDTADKVQVGGVHAGRDLKLDGDHNVVSGGDYSNGTTQDASAAPSSLAWPRRRRDRR
jgi:hypothetical protein